MTRVVRRPEPAEEVRRQAELFAKQGYLMLGRIVSRAAARDLRAQIEEAWHRLRDSPPESDRVRSVSLMRAFELSNDFRDLLALPRVVPFVEHVLGKDCHVVAQNALRTPPGKTISCWHVDDQLFFPFLSQVAAPEELQIPCYSLSVMLALSDVDSPEFGPTQVVPGSHLFGREPEWKESLPAEASPHSLLLRAGEAALINSQTWHRGAPNTSTRTRYLVASTYGRRFVSQRFYPFIDYRLPESVTRGADPKLLRLLGRHEKGPYG